MANQKKGTAKKKEEQVELELEGVKGKVINVLDVDDDSDILNPIEEEELYELCNDHDDSMDVYRIDQRKMFLTAANHAWVHNMTREEFNAIISRVFDECFPEVD